MLFILRLEDRVKYIETIRKMLLGTTTYFVGITRMRQITLLQFFLFNLITKRNNLLSAVLLLTQK
jgi:hypothetical protein